MCYFTKLVKNKTKQNKTSTRELLWVTRKAACRATAMSQALNLTLGVSEPVGVRPCAGGLEGWSWRLCEALRCVHQELLKRHSSSRLTLPVGLFLRAPTDANSSFASCSFSVCEVSVGGEMLWLSSGAAPSPSKQPGTGRRGLDSGARVCSPGHGGRWELEGLQDMGGSLQLPALPSRPIKSSTTHPRVWKEGGDSTCHHMERGWAI